MKTNRFRPRASLGSLILGLLLAATGTAISAVMSSDFGHGRLALDNEVGPTRPMLVILANFPIPGNAFANSTNLNYYRDLVFETNTISDTANRYFNEVSNGRFTWTNGGVIKVDLPLSDRRASYPSDQTYSSNIIYWAMAVNNFDLDYFNTEPSNPNVTDRELAITIFSNDLGSGAARHAGTVTPPGFSRSYQCLAYVYLGTDHKKFDIMCHEMAHLLGAKDFYGIWGTGECLNGRLSLMSCSYGEKYHIDAWHKMQFGWSDPRSFPITSSGTTTITAAQRGFAYAPVILYDPNRGPDEFFLLEYRTRTLTNASGVYDVNVAGNGLVIWHVSHNEDKMPKLMADEAWPNAEKPWRECTKCRALTFGDDPAGSCAAGGAHDPFADKHGLVINDPSAPGQKNWRYCTKCRALFYGPNQASSVCPADNQLHNPSSANYTLITDTGVLAHHYWRRCTKCETLFLGWLYPQGTLNTNGVCAADSGTHTADTTVEYTLPAFWSIKALQAEEYPDLRKSGSTPWPSDSTTPWLYWYDQTPASVSVHVHPFTTGAGSIRIDWISEVGTWVDFYNWGVEEGSFEWPFNTVAEGASAVPWNGFLHIKTGASSETPHLTKRMRIQAYNGPVVIGR